MATGNLDRVVIVMMSAIGDAVHVLPIVNALKRHSPTSRVTWILEPKPATLVRGHPAIDEIIEIPRSRGLGDWRRIRRSLRDREFDVALDFQVAFKAGLVTSMVNAPRKIGFDRRRARDLNWLFTNEKIAAHANQHVADQYFEFLDHLGVPHQQPQWNLGPWPHEADRARGLLPSSARPFAAIAIATTRADRDWPADRWARVIDALHDRHGVHAVLVGGRSPRELDAERVIRERSRHQPISTLGCTLRELVAVLHAAALVLTPDTAPMHIAVALGRPVISLFGSTDPRRTGPYRASQDLIVNAFRENDDSDDILIDKRPGRMQRIQVDDVLAKVELWNRSYR